MKTALVTGISGQDGSYLAELLLSKGYVVHGFTRSGTADLGSAEHLRHEMQLHSFASNDGEAWSDLLATIKPDEVYHLAADSFIPNGWADPVGNVDSNLAFTARLLEAIRTVWPSARFLNACSREIFGNYTGGAADEKTPMQPLTPYGINKAASRWLANSYRERYGVFTANAILFNHESPRRPTSFVTRKITRGVAEIALGLTTSLKLGNIGARRDWGFAGDFVDGMWRMLQTDEPQDFVLGTGKVHSIGQFAEMAFEVVGLSWREHVSTDPALLRPEDSCALSADGRQAAQLLNWRATTRLPELARMMVENDLRQLTNDLDVRKVA